MKTSNYKSGLQKNLITVVVASAMVMSCSKVSSQSSTAPTDSTNTGQGVLAPTKGISPALKVYANSVSDVTGLLGLGGQLMGVNFDKLTKGLDISLRLPATVLFLAQTYLLKYPQIQTSITNDADGSAVLHLKISFVDAVAAYKKWQQKNPDLVQTPPPVSELPPVVVNPPPATTTPNQPVTPTPVTPPVVVIPAGSLQGNYVGSITPASNGVFGDGSWPRGDATLLVERPDILGYGYALGGDFNFNVAADGTLSGVFTIWGYPCQIQAGQVPAGGNEVTVILPGSTAYIKFNGNGQVSGSVYEPGPQGDEWETHKLGYLSGHKN